MSSARTPKAHARWERNVFESAEVEAKSPRWLEMGREDGGGVEREVLQQVDCDSYNSNSWEFISQRHDMRVCVYSSSTSRVLLVQYHWKMVGATDRHPHATACSTRQRRTACHRTALPPHRLNDGNGAQTIGKRLLDVCAASYDLPATWNAAVKTCATLVVDH